MSLDGARRVATGLLEPLRVSGLEVGCPLDRTGRFGGSGIEAFAACAERGRGTSVAHLS
jgi:hypothetical protein